MSVSASSRRGTRGVAAREVARNLGPGGGMQNRSGRRFGVSADPSSGSGSAPSHRRLCALPNACPTHRRLTAPAGRLTVQVRGGAITGSGASRLACLGERVGRRPPRAAASAPLLHLTGAAPRTRRGAHTAAPSRVESSTGEGAEKVCGSVQAAEGSSVNCARCPLEAAEPPAELAARLVRRAARRSACPAIS